MNNTKRVLKVQHVIVLLGRTTLSKNWETNFFYVNIVIHYNFVSTKELESYIHLRLCREGIHATVLRHFPILLSG